MSTPRFLYVLAALPLLCAGCANSSDSFSRDSRMDHVGKFDPPPSGLQKVRVGCPDFQVKTGVTRDMSTVAADQLTTLAFKTKRFVVIERAQIGQLLKEQGLTGIVKPDEVAKKGAVRGVDYLIFGTVTNMRVKKEKSGGGFGLGRIPIPGARGSIGGFDYKNKRSTIKVDCGVDLRMVNPSTGEVVAADSAEISRTDSIGAFGITILGARADSDADLKIDANNRGKLLRLALHDAVAKMLDDIDQHLVNRAAASKKD